MASDCDYVLDTASEPTEGGTVRRDPDSRKILHGSSVVLTALPNEGYVFSHWEPSRDESPILSFSMGKSKETRTAVFVPFDPTLAVSQPPAVTIVSPERREAAVFENAVAIVFSGTAVDPEDGNLTGESLVWSSDVDGQIGIGESINAVLSGGRHVVTLSATDSASVKGVVAVNINVSLPPNTTPTVTLVSPEHEARFLTTDIITFSRSSVDVEDGSLTGDSLVWTSDIDGEIGIGELMETTLSEGLHLISLRATDSQQGSWSIGISVDVKMPVNARPVPSIDSPASGDTFLTTDSIAFSGSANDAEDGPLTGASLTWTSNLDGGLGSGVSVTASLTAGNHVIALDATDADGAMVSKFVSITVDEPPNALPTAAIVSPVNGDTFLTTDNIVFSGSANDPEDGALIANSLVWSSTVGGQIGTGGSFGASLGVGQHTISLTATDSRQGVATESVSITVAAPNSSPAVRITSPVPGETFDEGVMIAFAGTGNDPEEGPLVGASLVWESDFDGEIGTGESFSASLSAGRHIITLKATDHQQAEGSQSLAVTILVLPPTATPVPAATPVPKAGPLAEREAGLAPHLFFGAATLNGASAPDGTAVTAWVADFSEPVATATVADGQYKLSVFQYGKKSFAGAKIIFKIGGFTAMETGSWQTFGAELLNITAAGY